MKPLSLFWWKPEDAVRINLGDEISYHIVKALSNRDVVWGDPATCEITATGSIYQIIASDLGRRETPVEIWGTGLMRPVPPRTGPLVNFRSVRGSLTRCMVNQPLELPLGDPGIVVSDIWPAPKDKAYAIGIIPHISQLRSNIWRAVQEATPNSIILDFSSPDIEKTMAQIGSCERIASTSLHEVIFADSYKIPNIWMNGPEIHHASHFKFYDYFSSVGRTNFKPVDLKAPQRNLTKLNDSVFETKYFSKIDKFKQAVAAAFPSHLASPVSM